MSSVDARGHCGVGPTQAVVELVVRRGALEVGVLDPAGAVSRSYTATPS